MITACNKDEFSNDLADVPQDQYTVEINSSGFNPSVLESPSGQRVLWINADNQVHTVNSANGDVNSGDIAPGGTFNFTFTGIGDYSYSCSKHAGETGIIKVKGIR
jgi:plastocyanin